MKRKRARHFNEVKDDEELTRRRKLKQMLSEIEILYKVLSEIILDYETPLPLWQKSTSDMIFPVRLAHCIGLPTGDFVAIQEGQNVFYKFQVKGDPISTSFDPVSPTNQLMIAFDSHQNTLYLKDQEISRVFDMIFHLLGSLKILLIFKETFGIPMDSTNIYLTTRNAMWTLRKMDGLVLQYWKIEEEKRVHFRGITCDKTFLYIC